MTYTESEIADIVTQTLASYIEFAFLLGSAGTERFTSESDIDIAVYTKKQNTNSFDLKIKLTGLLVAKFKTKVDLIFLNEIDPIFSHQVLEKGRLIYNTNPGLLLQWKSLEMAKYPDFKYSRKVIEDNILKRKSHV